VEDALREGSEVHGRTLLKVSGKKHERVQPPNGETGGRLRGELPERKTAYAQNGLKPLALRGISEKGGEKGTVA